MDRDVWVVGLLRTDGSTMEVVFPVDALPEVLKFIQVQPHLYMERRRYEKSSPWEQARAQPVSEAGRLQSSEAESEVTHSS
jgi:hypothetical protein